MQKYRKFTDEKTGINPFIRAKRTTSNLAMRVLTGILKTIVFIVKLVLALTLLAIKVVVAILTTFMPSFIDNPITKLVDSVLSTVFLFLAGIYTREDKSIDGMRAKQQDAYLFVSNHSSLLDTFFYLIKLSPMKVLVQLEGKNEELSYATVQGLALIWAVLTHQGFYRKTDTKGCSLKQVYEKAKSEDKRLLVFFEGVRTNGLGVLSIREQLSNDLNDLECPIIITAVKYATSNYNINTVTEGVFWNLYEILTSTSILLKNKCRLYEKAPTTSIHELNNTLYELYDMFGLKRLDLVAADYFDFADFYQKTQRAGYTKDK